MNDINLNPFNHEYFLGYVSLVSPQYVRVHFPSSVLLNRFTHFGKEFQGGLVGNFVVIEGEKYGFLGRIIELSLPESERLSLSEKAFQTSDFHPTGKIELVLSFDLFSPLEVKKGLTAYPHIGAKVFISSGDLIQNYLLRFGEKTNTANTPVSLGRLVSNPDIEVKVNLQSIFGRHCAVVGTTGGGKSYTVSKLVESLVNAGGKAILIDATGEYNFEGLGPAVRNIKLGEGAVTFHYSQLTIDDLFIMLKPSEKSQAPKLMEAVRSLKIVRLANEQNKDKLTAKDILTGNLLEIPIQDGLLKKQGYPKRPYEEFFFKNFAAIENGICDFDFMKLASQITNECVYDEGSSWGRRNENDVSFCVNLISRVNNLISTSELSQVFAFQVPTIGNSDLSKVIVEFISQDKRELKLLRINLESVKFDFQVREILVNAIGKYLLNKARNGVFKQSPVVAFMDEAHQFLNKAVRDDYFGSKPLDAFDSIAKECRKHGLFLCISTQMPRDIPQGTLSQMGTFIVHRLINPYDKEAISNACSSANRNTLEFLPVLGEGEAILTGVDFPMPISMIFDKPHNEPDSGTPAIVNTK
jgi:Predicted ATPase